MQDKDAKLREIAELVDKSQIASIKKVTSGIMRIINDPDASARDLKAIVEVDPPLTANVLKIANSAYYSSRRHISDIEEAVIWIGFDKLKEIALNQKVCEVFHKRSVGEGYSRSMLWKHSVAVALLGKMIYRMEFGERGDTIYAAGLLHDIGLIAADQFLTRDFEEILARSRAEDRMQHFVESDFWGFTHADIGRAIGELWQLPEALRESIGHHHDIRNAPPEHAQMTATLYVSNHVCHENNFGFKTIFQPDPLQFRDCLTALNINAVSLSLIVAEMKGEIAKMEENGIL